MGCQDQLDWKQRLTDSQTPFRVRYELQIKSTVGPAGLKKGEDLGHPLPHLTVRNGSLLMACWLEVQESRCIRELYSTPSISK